MSTIPSTSLRTTDCSGTVDRWPRCTSARSDTWWAWSARRCSTRRRRCSRSAAGVSDVPLLQQPPRLCGLAPGLAGPHSARAADLLRPL